MKIALVHDYLKDFGGAERVLEALCEIWPEAPIYTAFVDKNSSAYSRFKDRKIITSWAQKVPFFGSYLHSPLRFLAPLVWNSFNFSDFDLVVASSSWYVTKGFRRSNKESESQRAKGFVEVCYCHTPPRYLYGYPTSVEWQKYWPTRIYAILVNHFMRVYDFEASQKVDFFIANSREVAARIKKFYRKDSRVIYPPTFAEASAGKPVDVGKFAGPVKAHPRSVQGSNIAHPGGEISGRGYFLVVSRLVAAKKVDIVVEVCAKLELPLKVVGTGKELENLKKLARIHSRSGDKVSTREHSGSESSVEFLGEVKDSELVSLYQNCRAVIFPASQEDFGLVPVEAMACGKPVIVHAQGGVLESVIDAIPAGKGKGTGVYFDPSTTGSLTLALNNFMDLEKKGYFDPQFIRRYAQKFSKDRFKREILKFVESKVR